MKYTLHGGVEKASWLRVTLGVILVMSVVSLAHIAYQNVSKHLQALETTQDVQSTSLSVNEPYNGSHEFKYVPTSEVHTMRVFEDGSYEIVYKDGTSEIGCLQSGLCQD